MSVRSFSSTGKVDIQKELRVFTGMGKSLKTHFGEVTIPPLKGRTDARACYCKCCMSAHMY
jgi:hypothetical protein